MVLEATASRSPEESGAVWREYEFKCKPGNTSAAPCLISPYHYRLDWLMWFAAFQSYQQNPWLLHLMGKMLENDPVVDSLIAYNPFKGKPPPRFIRAKHYKVKEYYDYALVFRNISSTSSPESEARQQMMDVGGPGKSWENTFRLSIWRC